MNGMERRVRQLERLAPAGGSGLPWGRPPVEWTNEQLAAAVSLGEALSEAESVREQLGDQLIHGRPGAIMLGVEEIQSAEEWVRRYRGDA